MLSAGSEAETGIERGRQADDLLLAVVPADGVDVFGWSWGD